MSAVQLFHKDGRDAGVFFCSECRIVYKTEQEADECHGEKLCACGKPRERYRKLCRDCQNAQWQKEHQEREQARFEKAAKVGASEYIGEAVFDPHSDRYTYSLDEALEHYDDDDTECPEYFWACKNVGVTKAHVSDITERMVENMWEDADESDLKGVAELEAAINAFNEANKAVKVWQPDYSTAILVSKAVQA